jgi:hypothetical protein
MKHTLSRFELYGELKPMRSQVLNEEFPRLSEVCEPCLLTIEHPHVITQEGNPLHAATSFPRFDWTERDNVFKNWSVLCIGKQPKNESHGAGILFGITGQKNDVADNAREDWISFR